MLKSGFKPMLRLTYDLSLKLKFKTGVLDGPTPSVWRCRWIDCNASCCIWRMVSRRKRLRF